MFYLLSDGYLDKSFDYKDIFLHVVININMLRLETDNLVLEGIVYYRSYLCTNHPKGRATGVKKKKGSE